MSTESLEFLLDLDAKIDGMMGGLDAIEKTIKGLQNLDKAGGKLAETTRHVERASHGAREAHDKHGQSLLNLGHQYAYAKRGAMEFAEAIGLVIAFEAIEKLLDKVKELGEEMITAGAKAERTEVSFKLLLGKHGGDELLEYLEDLHKHTEFSLEALQGLAGSLMRVGFEGKGLRYAVAAAADLAALPGGNLEQAAHSLGQVKRTGKVDNRALRGVGFGEQDFLAQLAERTGKSAKVLKKEIDKGKDYADESMGALYDLIRRRTGKALGGGAEVMGGTMGAAIVHLKEAPEELFKQLEKSPAWDRLKGVITTLTDQLDPKSALGVKFFQAMDKGLTNLVVAIEKLDMDKLVTNFGQLVDRLPAVIDLLVGVAKAMFLFGKAAVWVYEHTVPGQVLKGMLAPKAELDAEKAHKTALGLMGPAHLPAATDAAAGIRSQLWGDATADGMAKGLDKGRPKVERSTKGLGETTTGTMEEELGIKSPSRVFEHLGRMSGEGYLQGLDNSMAAMTDSVPVGSFARPASGAAGGPIQVSVHVETHVNAHGGGGSGEAGAAEIGQQVATHVESILPAALQSAFERMRQEAGS